MAEEEAAKGGLDFLKQKVGPLPIGVWMAAALVIYLYMKKKNSSTASSTGAQTDPAGNVGTIDPSTGYVYGSSQDTSALGSQNSGGSTGTTSGSGGSTVAGQYADNNAWARAAINFLVGVGVDPTAANSAVTQYIGSQPLTPTQQADVNLAIQSIGAPPEPPAPGNSPTPIVNPPSPGPVYATNPPTGLAVSSKSANSIAVKWNKATNATAYTVTYATGSQSAQTVTVSGTSPAATITGLQPNTLYSIKVQGTPAKSSDAFASISVTTNQSTISGGQPPKGGGGTPVPPIPTPGPPVPTKTHVYTVVSGDNLSSIASRNGTTLAVIKQLNPVYWSDPKYKQGNLIFPGDKVTLPGAG